MQPHEIRMLRSHAAMVQDRHNKAEQLNTLAGHEAFAWAVSEFSKRWPHYNWRDWAPKEESVQR